MTAVSDRDVIATQPTLGDTMDNDPKRVTAVLNAQHLEEGDVIESPRPNPILRVERTPAEGRGRVRVVFADGTSRWFRAEEPVVAKVPAGRVRRDTVSTLPGKNVDL